MASTTEDELRSYGLSGEPLSWVPDAIRTAVGAIRQSNLNPANANLRAAAEVGIASVDPAYDPDHILLGHAITGTFTIDVDAMVATCVFDDFDLNLPGANVHWDFGDRTGPIFQSTATVEHTYASAGTFTVNLSVAVAGVIFGSTQTVTAPDDIEPPPPIVPTGVTQGAPGGWSPAGAEVPYDLAALQGLGALGQTAAWAEGNYVMLGDGSSAYWNGTGWVLGVAPIPADPEFDPDDHSISEVKAYVNDLPNEGHASSVTQRILNRERATKNRASLVDWLDRKLGVT